MNWPEAETKIASIADARELKVLSNKITRAFGLLNKTLYKPLSEDEMQELIEIDGYMG